ncbi:MAG: SGNH/GDSL hydrolase family protein [Gammaproteobacteria bacterium]
MKMNQARYCAVFPVDKPANTYRAFALGGSTTEGQPYGNPGSFPFWFEQELRHRHPDRNIEVINIGIRGFGSSRVLQILREAVHYDPNLIVVYTGQNEFRDARFHPYELRRSEREAEILAYALRIRVLYLVRQIVMEAHAMFFGKQQISYGGEKIESAVETSYSPDNFGSYEYFTVPEIKASARPSDGLDSAVRPAGRTRSSFMSGMKDFVKRTFRLGWMGIPDDEVYAIFQRNITQMMETANSADVPIVFIKKTMNPQVRNVLQSITYTIPAGVIDAYHQLQKDSPAGIVGYNYFVDSVHNV